MTHVVANVVVKALTVVVLADDTLIMQACMRESRVGTVPMRT
jgi:hypothetical protein